MTEKKRKKKGGGRKPEGPLSRVPFLTSPSAADSKLGPVYGPRM